MYLFFLRLFFFLLFLLILFLVSIFFLPKNTLTNFCVLRVQLLEGEGSSPLPAFIGVGGVARTEAFCSVTYRSKTPTFHDELRVCLPHALTPSTHFLFSFYHLKFKQKQDASKSNSHSSLAAGTASVQFQQLNEVMILHFFFSSFFDASNLLFLIATLQRTNMRISSQQHGKQKRPVRAIKC